MTQPSDISRTRVRLSKLGMGEEDVSWLEARRWSEAAIPPSCGHATPMSTDAVRLS